MTNYVDKDCKEFKDAEKVADMVNSLIYDKDAFCQGMKFQHRTLQENFTELCIHWLVVAGSDDYQYDARNEYAHTIAKRVLKDILSE